MVKLNRYARAGLPRYWIPDPGNRVLLAYALTDGMYDLVKVVDEHEPRDVGYGTASARVDVAALLP